MSESINELQQEVTTSAEQETVETTAQAETQDVLQTKEAVLNRVKELARGDEELKRQELDALKSAFYRFHNQEAEEARKKYLDEGGVAEDYQPLADPDELVFKEQMAIIRDKRAEQQKAEEQLREENYNKKQQIIDKIKTLLENPDDVNKSYKDFKNLQTEWNEIGEVPVTKANDLWRDYQKQVEQFYDTLKLNNELRAYDFKKNLELKTKIIEATEKLADEPDPISAFRQLQVFHQQFREVGPVEREKREEIWERFKAASTVINKRHQEHFEARKAQEEENLKQKTSICEEIETIVVDDIKTFADWNALTEKITALQAKWKTIGFAPQKHNTKIYERFRATCDNFFQKKSEFFKGMRESMTDNLELKRELCEKAEALKDSTAWKETTDALIELQKKWKEVGAVPRKYSEELWKRFSAACDAFFEAKKSATSSQYAEQSANLEKKKTIIQRLKEMVTPEQVTDELRELINNIQDEWNEVGHVPFKDKDKIFKEYHKEMDRFYNMIGVSAAKRRMERFKTELKNGGADKLRDRLTRQYDILKNEIKTYENNLGFLTLSSKSKQGNSLVDELNRKVEKLRNDLEEIKMKIKACDQADTEDTQDDEPSGEQ